MLNLIRTRLIGAIERLMRGVGGGRLPVGEQTVFRVLVGSIVVGVLLRLILIAVSYGSDDMHTWHQFADAIRAGGIWDLYQPEWLFHSGTFNHPPLIGWMAAGLRSFGSWAEIPFRILFKLPLLAGDVAVMVVLWRYWRQSGRIMAAAAVALFSLNPISILITAHHGNTDSLVGAFGLFAAFAMSRRRYATAGLMLALASNVKIVGLLWAPGLFLLCFDRRAASRFVSGMAAGMLPFVLVFLVAPADFSRNVLFYVPEPQNWGILTLVAGGESRLEGPSTEFLRLLLVASRYLIVGAVLFWAVLGRVARFDPLRAAALAMAACLTLATGFGIQYLVWIVPVLAAASLRFSLRYAVLGGLVATLVYYTWLIDGWPLTTVHGGIPSPAWVIGLFVWSTLLSFQFSVLRGVFKAQRSVREPLLTR